MTADTARTQPRPNDAPQEPAPPPTVPDADAQYRPFPSFAAFIRAAAREGKQSLDQSTWDRQRAELHRARETHTAAEYDRAVETALRAAALDTGALEGLYEVDYGFTMTVATREAGWEEAIERRERDTGRPVSRLFESQLDAYRLAQDVAAGEDQPVTEAWVRAVHARVTKAQDTYRARVEGPGGPAWQEVELRRGEYKTQPNHVVQPDGTVFAYAPVDQTAPEMHRLVQELRGKVFAAAHPIVQAAYVHYVFTRIHPFADGNGRTARVLASVFLLRQDGLPLVVLDDRRQEYLEALRAADAGAYESFVAFIFDRMVDTLQFVTDHLGSLPADEVRALQEALEPRQGLTYRRLEAVGMGYFVKLIERLKEALGRLSLPAGVGVEYTRQPVRPPPHATEAPPDTDRYRIPIEGDQGIFTATLSSPHELPGPSSTIALDFRIARDSNDRYPFLLERPRTGRPPDSFPIRLQDVWPEETDDLRRRIDKWLERQVAEALRRYRKEAEQALRQRGY